MKELRVRDIRETPFVYQSVFALRKVREGCSPREYQNTLAVYVVLCEICSNNHSEEVETFVSSISMLVKLSEKTVSKCLEKLANLMLIAYPPQERTSDGKYAPRKIALLSIGDSGEKILPAVKTKSRENPARRAESRENSQGKFRESSMHESSDIKNLLIEPSYRTSSTYVDFVKVFNELKGSKFRANKKVEGQFKARLQEGFTLEDFKQAVKNCLSDEFHRQNPNYLTPEFITRPDKLEKYLNYQEIKQGGKIF